MTELPLSHLNGTSEPERGGADWRRRSPVTCGHALGDPHPDAHRARKTTTSHVTSRQGEQRPRRGWVADVWGDVK